MLRTGSFGVPMAQNTMDGLWYDGKYRHVGNVLLKKSDLQTLMPLSRVFLMREGWELGGQAGEGNKSW